MTSFIFKSKAIVSFVGLLALVLCAITLVSQAKEPSAQAGRSLRIEPIQANYIERERGNVFSFACLLINNGDSDITVVTEHLNLSGPYMDKQTNSLRCTLLFEDNPATANVHPLVPSIYTHAPVLLHPGEATTVHYVQDFSKRITGPQSMDSDNLKAETVTITYKVCEKWGKRFDLWYGEQTAEPVKFNKALK